MAPNRNKSQNRSKMEKIILQEVQAKKKIFSERFVVYKQLMQVYTTVLSLFSICQKKYGHLHSVAEWNNQVMLRLGLRRKTISDAMEPTDEVLKAQKKEIEVRWKDHKKVSAAVKELASPMDAAICYASLSIETSDNENCDEIQAAFEKTGIPAILCNLDNRFLENKNYLGVLSQWDTTSEALKKVVDQLSKQETAFLEVCGELGIVKPAEPSPVYNNPDPENSDEED